MHGYGFSFSPAGEWSKPQLDAALRVLQPEAALQGLECVPIDVSSQSHTPRFLISVRCAKHHSPIAPNDACQQCVAEPYIPTGGKQLAEGFVRIMDKCLQCRAGHHFQCVDEKCPCCSGMGLDPHVAAGR